MARSLSNGTVRVLTFTSGPIILFLFYCSLFVMGGSIPANLSDELFVILFQVVWISIPFLALGLNGQARPLPWVVAGFLNVAFLVYILVDARRAAINETGANIGAGLFFFILPIIITPICLSLGKVKKKLP